MRFLLFLVFSLSCDFIQANPLEQALNQRLQAIHSMSANFTQVVHSKRHPDLRTQGNMALVRPSHFRWQTRSPSHQLLIADGQNLSIYDKDLEQVYVRKQKNHLDGMADLFLSRDHTMLMRRFNIRSLKIGHQEVYDLSAKSSHAELTRVRLIFNGPLLMGIDMRDQLGQSTEIRLTNVRVNTKVSRDLFVMKVPHGVDVVKE